MKFILASSMVIGLALLVSQASAATVDEPTGYSVARSPESWLNWKLSRHQEYWNEGYYANTVGKTAIKEEWIIYMDSIQQNETKHIIQLQHIGHNLVVDTVSESFYK
ncbi:hypothetical protein COE51_17980 [Bacillus pseudomycoides]|nr:hypothetical protein COE51_17980 [Bacillus pseudomycoides]